MTSPTTIAEILAQAENPAYVRVRTARVLLRQDLAAELDDLTERLAVALRDDNLENREPLAPGVAEELRAFEDRVESEKVPFKFKSIGHRAWADLLAEHPPTLEQRRADPKADHNPKTFPIAAMAASSHEPTMEYADVERLDKALNDSQFVKLWKACLDANMGLEAPKQAAAGLILRASGRLGGSAANEGSLDQSSSEGNEPAEQPLSES